MQQLQSTIRIHLDSCFRHLMNVSFWSASLSFWKYLGLLLTNASPCSPEHHVLLSRFYSLYSTARYCHQELGETKKRAAARELQSDLRSSAGQTDDANWKTMVLCNCCMRKYATVCRQICRINLKVDDMSALCSQLGFTANKWTKSSREKPNRFFFVFTMFGVVLLEMFLISYLILFALSKNSLFICLLILHFGLPWQSLFLFLMCLFCFFL